MVDGYHFSDLEDRYVNVTGDTMTGSLTVKQYIFGYNYNHAGGNAPAFIFDKPGSNFTGIGCHSTSDTIWFGAASISNGEAVWVDTYKQKWVFNGTVTADHFYGPLTGNVTGNADTATNATNATNLTGNPSLQTGTSNTNAITVTAGNKTSDEFVIPYSTKTLKLISSGSIDTTTVDSFCESSAFKMAYLGNTEANTLFSGSDGFLFSVGVSGGYGHQIHIDDTQYNIWHRKTKGPNLNWDSWVKILDTSNVSPSLNISGNTIATTIGGVTSSYITVPYATSAGNADTVDSLHASNFTKFYLSPLESSAPADSAKSWFINTMPSGMAAIVYNVPGSEKTIIVGKSSGSYGHMLQIGYNDNYLRLLRYEYGSWKTTDWEKISAGYADSAGSVAWDNVTGKPSTFTPSTHDHDDKYVLKTGDTITNVNFGEQLTIKRTSDGGDAVIKFQTQNTVNGYIGVRADLTPVFYSGTNTSGSGNLIWHSGNDGSGSGLDADLLDGYHYNQLPYLSNSAYVSRTINGGSSNTWYRIARNKTTDMVRARTTFYLTVDGGSWSTNWAKFTILGSWGRAYAYELRAETNNSVWDGIRTTYEGDYIYIEIHFVSACSSTRLYVPRNNWSLDNEGNHLWEWFEGTLSAGGGTQVSILYPTTSGINTNNGLMVGDKLVFPQGGSTYSWNRINEGYNRTSIRAYSTAGQSATGAPDNYSIGIMIDGYYSFALAGKDGGANLVWRNNSGTWYDIITSQNIGSQSVNSSTWASKLYNPTIITTSDDLDAFHEAYCLKAAIWTSFNTSILNSNGLVIDIGYTSATYGAQILIDDDPTYVMGLRQRSGSGWSNWKRIPMGDGTGASGNWNINSVNVTGIVAIANGGTGASTAAGARANLSTWALVSDSYNTLMPADGTTNGWIKIGTNNSDYGLLPSTSGGAGSGHNYLGTSSWYWKYAYIDQIYGYLNGNISGNAAYATNAGNADTVDNLHASNLVKFYLSPLEGSAPATSAKTWFTDTMPSSSGAIVYNVPGSEKTIIVGKSSGAYGHMLQIGYDDTYLRMLRYQAGSWKSTDWEKISAGYADIAGSANSVAWDNVTGKPSTFTPSSHTHDDRYYTESESDDRYVNVTGDTMTGSLTVKQYIFGYNYNHAGGNAPAWVFDKPGGNFTGIGGHSTSDTIWFGAATISSGEAVWVDTYKQKWVFNGTVTADQIYSNGLYHVTSGSRSNNYVWNTNGGYTDISSLSSSVSVTNSAPALGKTAATIATIGGTAITASVGDSDKVDGLHFWTGSSLPSSPSSDTIYIIV